MAVAFEKPLVVPPVFWLSNLDGVYRYLDTRLERGRRLAIGRSACNRRIDGVQYRGRNSHDAALMVIGGTHGHEPGTVAAAMNLIHLMETGADLDGRPHERLRAVLECIDLTVVPMLNPDGRAVCLDTFYNLPLETVYLYACGLTLEGELVPYDSESEEPLFYFDPKQCLFIGGQFNGAGHAINRPRRRDGFDAVEADHLLRYLQANRHDACFDMHACGYNFAFQARSHEPVYWPIFREWHRRAAALFARKSYPLRALHGDGDPPPPVTMLQNSWIMHHQAKVMWMAFEGRQGFPGKPFWPLSTPWEILDAYLEAITVFAELGAERAYAQANAAVFGGQ